MSSAAFLSLVFAYNIASALGQTCTKGTGTDGLYTECMFSVGNTAFTKPIGVSSIGFQLIGGRGGLYSQGDFGLSAGLQGSLDFSTDSAVEVVLSVIVGQSGQSAAGEGGNAGGSGYGSGGASGVAVIGGAGGGGSSALLIPASDTVLVVAAGGGGGAFFGPALAPDPSSLDSFDDPEAPSDGATGSGGDFFGGGGSGGGRRGGGGVQGSAGNPGNPGRSYYNPLYNPLAPDFSAPVPRPTSLLSGTAVLTFLTPIVPSGGGGGPPGGGRQRARRLQRHSLCAPNHRICSNKSAVCVDLQTSLEHCGTCNNDCSGLGDRAICNNGVCKEF